MTKKQQEEIDFLCKFFGGKMEDSEEYIAATVYGKSATSDKLSGNSLRIAKTKLDRNIKMWREDLDSGLLFPQELLSELGNSVFGKKVLYSVFDSTRFYKGYGKEDFQSFPVLLMLKQQWQSLT